MPKAGCDTHEECTIWEGGREQERERTSKRERENVCAGTQTSEAQIMTVLLGNDVPLNEGWRGGNTPKHEPNPVPGPRQAIGLPFRGVPACIVCLSCGGTAQGSPPSERARRQRMGPSPLADNLLTPTAGPHCWPSQGWRRKVGEWKR